MEFGLIENPPSSGAAPSLMERVVQPAAENGRGMAMSQRRARGKIEISLDNLRDLVLRRGNDILIKRAAFDSLRHASEVTSEWVQYRGFSDAENRLQAGAGAKSVAGSRHCGCVAAAS